MKVVRLLACLLCFAVVACSPICSDDPEFESASRFPSFAVPTSVRNLRGWNPTLRAGDHLDRARHPRRRDDAGRQRALLLRSPLAAAP